MRITTFAYYKTTQSMKRKIIMALLAAICTTTVANETIEVSVNNPLKQTRTDQPVVISLKQYGDVHSALVTTDGKEIACQLDDLDRTNSMTSSVSWLTWEARRNGNTSLRYTTRVSHVPTLPESMPKCS